MKNLILTLIITLPLTLRGQVWEQTYGNQNDFDNKIGYSIIEINDGGYVLTGTDNNELFILKLDVYGNEVWYNTYPSKELGYDIKQTTDNGFIITGWEWNNQYDIFLLKIDSDGNEQWSKTFGGQGDDYSYSLEITSDNGFIISGEKDYSGILIKTDINGLEQWNRSNYCGIITKITKTNDNGYILSCREGNILKINSEGDIEWTNSFNLNWVKSIEQTSEGGYIFVGIGYVFVGIGNVNITGLTLVKLDNKGNQSWTQTYGGFDGSSYPVVKQTFDNGFIITGRKNIELDSNNEMEDDVIWLLRTNSSGDLLWDKVYGGLEQDVSYSLEITSDEGYIISGTSDSFDNFEDRIYVIKTNSFGNITSTFEIPLPNPNRKIEKIVNIKGQEIKPQTNTPIIEIFDDGNTEKKIIIDK